MFLSCLESTLNFALPDSLYMGLANIPLFTCPLKVTMWALEIIKTMNLLCKQMSPEGRAGRKNTK